MLFLVSIIFHVDLLLIELLHSSNDYSTDNEDSVMTYIDYGNLEVLLTGDVEKRLKLMVKNIM